MFASLLYYCLRFVKSNFCFLNLTDPSNGVD